MHRIASAARIARASAPTGVWIGASCIVAVALLAAGCSGSSSTPPPPGSRIAALTKVSGDSQLGWAGEELPDAVVVRVTDDAGAPVRGQLVNFRVTLGAGSVFAGAALTDASGVARERWTLGPVTGLDPAPQALEARAVDSTTGDRVVFATFQASAIAHPPVDLAYAVNPASYPAGSPIAPNAPSCGGGAVVRYSASPALPPGLALDAATGVVSGTPTTRSTGTYTILAENSGGSTTVDLVVAVTGPPPVIEAQPRDVTVAVGETATFGVQATGEGTLRYAWRRDGAVIADATSSTYTTAPATRGDAGARFTVTITDDSGATVTSRAATLYVAENSTLVGALATARAYHTATLLGDGTVLVVGGDGCPDATFCALLASSERYDPAAGTFSSGPDLATARDFHTATLLGSGDVLVAGGETNANPAERYGATLGAFAPTGSLGAVRAWHTATLLQDGKVLVAGGWGGSACLSSAEIYDPATGVFTPTGDLGACRYYHSATLLPDGTVLIAGGIGDGALAATSERYDPATGTFSATGAPSTPRFRHQATLLASGKVLVTGGIARDAVGSDVVTASAELYDPATDSFTSTGAMAAARSWHTATRVPDGRVLVAGGFETRLAEVYDPATSAFTAAGVTFAPRYAHTATLLGDGTVLLAGGVDDAGFCGTAEVLALPAAP